MDHENTIPSQLGPVNTIPAPLAAMTGRIEPLSESGASMGVGLKLMLLVLAAALLAYLII